MYIEWIMLICFYSFWVKIVFVIFWDANTLKTVIKMMKLMASGGWGKGLKFLCFKILFYRHSSHYSSILLLQFLIPFLPHLAYKRMLPTTTRPSPSLGPQVSRIRYREGRGWISHVCCQVGSSVSRSPLGSGLELLVFLWSHPPLKVLQSFP